MGLISPDFAAAQMLCYVYDPAAIVEGTRPCKFAVILPRPRTELRKSILEQILPGHMRGNNATPAEFQFSGTEKINNACTTHQSRALYEDNFFPAVFKT
jgi:hypothetical protein